MCHRDHTVYLPPTRLPTDGMNQPVIAARLQSITTVSK